MKMIKVMIISLVLISLVFGVQAEQNTGNITNVNAIATNLRELPELDMTGLHTDIELIEVDQEIIDANENWIILAHDEAGKKALIDDIEGSSLTAAEKNEMKSTVNNLWETYPTKFVDAGQKTIEITIQSDGSHSTKIIPIGHVTRIEFDRDKITQNALKKNTPDAKRLVALSTSKKAIVLSPIENKTLQNITSFRSKLIEKDQVSQSQQTSSKGSSPALSYGNSYSAGSLVSSESFSSSNNPGQSRFSSSFGDGSGSPETGLMAWGGSWNPQLLEDDPTNAATGHYSFIYWACKRINYLYAVEAAAASMVPDTWPAVSGPIYITIAGIPIDVSPQFNQIMHCKTHYWNPELPLLGEAPQKFLQYADESRSSSGVDAAIKLGWASHFITDLANPMHTGAEAKQVILYPIYDVHGAYEGYVEQKWQEHSFGNLVENNDVFYRITYPDEAAENTAIFSHAYLDTLLYRVLNQPKTDTNPEGFDNDPVVKKITENCILIAARYTGGLVEYTQDHIISEIAIADFTATPTSGNPPLTVHFTDKTHYRGSLPTTYTWDFGDGHGDTGRVIYDHTYEDTGIFIAKLTVTNDAGTTEKEMPISVVVGDEMPIADFNYYQDLNSEPLTYQFIDNSQNSRTSWLWEFGDGEISTESNPSHTYDEVKYYNIKLIVSNINGYDDMEKNVLVNYPTPIAIISHSASTGTAPLTVQFSDETIGWIDTRTWDFDDESPTSNEKNPQHTFQNPGQYTVTLTSISYQGGTNTNTTEITVLTPPTTASFTATPTSGYTPLTVQFTDTSTYSPTNWSWEFGDGATSTEQNPSYTYNTAGNYTVNLTATNAGGSDSFVRTAYITVMPRSIVSAGSVNITQPGEQATMLLTLDSVSDGLGGYNLNLTFSNQSVAQVTAVSFPEWASSMNYNSPLPAGQDLVVKASDVNGLMESGAVNIELANITVQGLVPGQTELLISRTNFDDDAGYDIPHVTVNGNVTVGD